ncbi:MAG: hypothetical protein ACKVY0_16815 [Prosthecobacter sp.]|uniref:hypothetical protein n=1 Tax=Prosthecobacter sp. TaxID=1965333 RepID=UPI0039014CA2
MSTSDDLPTAPPAESADDFATLIVAKSATSPTQTVTYPSGANPAAPVPFVFGRRIAQGGMGAILEADDCKLGRKIAVKVMLSEAACSEEQKQHKKRRCLAGWNTPTSFPFTISASIPRSSFITP